MDCNNAEKLASEVILDSVFLHCGWISGKLAICRTSNPKDIVPTKQIIGMVKGYKNKPLIAVPDEVLRFFHYPKKETLALLEIRALNEELDEYQEKV